MKTREIFQKDPLAWTLANQGVSSNNDEDVKTLRYELENFVCDGEYETGLRRILQGYRDAFGSSEQKAAWISGFYGSGKSHLAKVLRYLWVNEPLADGSKPRDLAHLPAEISELLTEISTLGKRHNGLHAVGGTLKAGAGSVRLRVLGLFFKSVGLSDIYQYSRFVLHLKADGKLEEFKQAVKEQGKEFHTELGRMYTSAALARAYVKCYPHVKDTAQVGHLLRAEYPSNVSDISMDVMRRDIRDAIAQKGKLPCTILVLDEIQQFVGADPQIALDVQEVTEALSKEMDGRLMIVGTGQSALNDMPNLQRLMGRFNIKIHLRDNDVEKVVRKVVLQKKEDKKPELKQLVARHEGEIARQLKGTKLATQNEDAQAYVPDFPLLPVRRRFWEKVLQSVDASGTTAQMRTQLRVVHEACRAYANAEFGAVVPGDFLYDQIANDLVSTGEMQKRFQEMIEGEKLKVDGALRSRICALVFMITKLPREQGVDYGVRAEPEHLADLLSNDLVVGSTQLRQQIPGLLSAMEQDGVLMKIDSEYRLQTTEGAAWEAEYRKRRAAILNDEPRIAARRSQLLEKAVNITVGNASVLHGDAKERRKVMIHFGDGKPDPFDGITLWVRDGFSSTEKAVLADVQRLSTDDPTLHLFLPKTRADELKNAIASQEAAAETVNFKGNPTSQEGKECRQGMLTRQNTDDIRIAESISDILRDARLYLSGGQQQPVISLKEGVENGARQVLNRLYPKFGIGDAANWELVFKKAKDGAGNALERVGYKGDTNAHPVAKAILDVIGSGKTGLDIRQRFNAPPYGWSKDAVDGVLVALTVSGDLNVRLNGKALLLSEIDQRNINQATFNRVSPVPTVAQKLAIRRLFQDAGFNGIVAGNEAADAARFIAFARQIAGKAGGDAPAPMPPVAPEIGALESLSGNDLVIALYDQREMLLPKILTWKAKGSEIAKRLPNYDLAQSLVAQATGLLEHAGWVATLSAVRANRSLLEDPDPVADVLKAAANALRAAVGQEHKANAEAYASQLARLEAHEAWRALPEEKRQALLARASAQRRPAPDTSTDTALLGSLQACSLSTWRAHTSALSAQFDSALGAAILESEPKARFVTLRAATIHDETELDTWLKGARASISAALKDGPVIPKSS